MHPLEVARNHDGGLRVNIEEKGCVIVPAYMEQGRIGRVVEGCRKHCPNIVVVDDGSSDNTAEEARQTGALVIRHDVNRGKGVSLDDGFKYACGKSFEFAVTMDGDGQHDPDDLPGFFSAYVSTGIPVLIGNRMADPAGMPLVRRLTNRFMSWMLSRKMGQSVPDTQCGYRLYRCDLLPGISVQSGRFAAESEILLCLAGQGVRMGSVAIRVIYRDEKSKISPVRDTIRFFSMLRKYDSGKERS